MNNLGLAAAAAILSALPAMAQQWEPGEGCTAFLTVQSKGCRVSTYWTCAGAPDGYVYRAVHEVDGRTMALVVDGEGNWVDSLFSDGWRERLLYPVADPISITALAETGMDSYDFELLSNGEDAESRILTTRVQGVDILTGRRVEIDGEELIESTFLLTYASADGVVYGIARGEQLYSPDLNMIFGAKDEMIEGETVTEYDTTPVDFVRPGEAGFASIQPVHGCEATLPIKDDTGAKSKD